MTTLCNRCELLFQECRPLRGVICPVVAFAPPPPEPEDSPKAGRPVHRAAIVVDQHTGEGRAEPFLAIDFYEGRP